MDCVQLFSRKVINLPQQYNSTKSIQTYMYTIHIIYFSVFLVIIFFYRISFLNLIGIVLQQIKFKSKLLNSSL